MHSQRRASKPNSDLLVEAKRLWAVLARRKDKNKDASPEEREKNVKALMDVIRGRVGEIVFKHDASRIVQSVVKYGGQKERDEIAGELKGKYRDLAQSKYSKVLLLVINPIHLT